MSSENSPSNAERILITGATSYLGSRLVRRLLNAGRQVHVLVRPTSDKSRLGQQVDNLTIHVHDGSMEGMTALMKRAVPDLVCHLATQYVRDHAPDQVESLINSNVLFGGQVLEAMKQTGVRRLIHPATFFQYFDSNDYRPVNLYAATKQAFEDILAYYVDAHDFRATTVVLYDIYGPGDWRKKLMAAIRDALRNGTPLPLAAPDMVMDLVYVDDVVDALIHARDNDVVGGPYAISSGTRHTLGEVIAVFESIENRKIDSQWNAFPLPPRSPLEPWNGPALPGWQARVSLEDGIRQFLAEEAPYAN